MKIFVIFWHKNKQKEDKNALESAKYDLLMHEDSGRMNADEVLIWRKREMDEVSKLWGIVNFYDTNTLMYYLRRQRVKVTSQIR